MLCMNPKRAVKAYIDGSDDGPVHLGKPGMHKHEAVKQFDELWQYAGAHSTETLFIVQTTDCAR